MKDVFCGCALIVGLIGYGCSSPSDSSHVVASSSPAAVTTEPSLSQDERLYLQAMAAHEKAGLNLAQEAQSRAQDKSLKQVVDRLVSDYNQRLRGLEALGAVAPDGRENPEQEKRSMGSPQTEATGSAPSSLETGPGAVAEGPGSYDQRWLKTFRQHHDKGAKLAVEMQPRIKNRGLLEWHNAMIQGEKKELTELQSLRVL